MAVAQRAEAARRAEAMKRRPVATVMLKGAKLSAATGPPRAASGKLPRSDSVKSARSGGTPTPGRAPEAPKVKEPPPTRFLPAPTNLTNVGVLQKAMPKRFDSRYVAL